jgi:CBS-domain-containing membrane protein
VFQENYMSETLDYRPLQQTQISSAGCYVLEAFNPPQVSADSAAILAMTDLARVPSATIGPEASLHDANHSMVLRGVRLLLVVVEGCRIAGVVTSVDVLGEKPLMVAQQRQIKRTELRVADVMVPVERMEVLRIEDVRRANVGSIAATLRADGRAHALVVGQTPNGRQSLLGIFSATQIARQLGVQIHTHEMARTFAEIEAVIHGV